MTNFSVLLSVYRNERAIHLKEAIGSVSLHQSIQPSEIILIKDGLLTSELEEIITDLKKKIPYLKTYEYDQNKGLGYALNFGLDKCSNELVFRMDTDDIAHPQRFETQIKYLHEYPELAIIGTTIEEFNEVPGDLKQFRSVPLTSERIERTKVNRNPFNHMTVLYRKSMIKKVGGYKDMPGYEDYYLWMRLLKQNKGININEPLVFARIGNDMIRRRHGLEFFKKEIQFQKRLRQEGLISNIIFTKNIILRGVPRILPISILQIIYTKLLRK